MRRKAVICRFAEQLERTENMNEEMLWEFWQKYVARFSFTPETEDYLSGKCQDLSKVALAAGSGNYLLYPNELLKALGGEGEALARRMFQVIAKLRGQGVIYLYGWEDDTRYCAKMGMSFDQILRGGFLKRSKDYQGKKAYDLARILLEELPAEAEEYAYVLLHPELSERGLSLKDQMIGFLKGRKPSRLDELIHNRKQDAGIYLMLDIACLLLLQDKEKHIALLPAIERCAGELGGDSIVVLLYYAHPLSALLRERLVKLLLEREESARMLFYNCVPTGAFQAFLASIALPPSYYYTLLALDGLKATNVPAVFRKLYAENRDTFYETYRRLTLSQEYNAAERCFPLVAIMLQNSEGQQELQAAQQSLRGFAKQVLTPIGGKKNAANGWLENNDVPVTEQAEHLELSGGFYGGRSEILGGYGTLYEASPVVRRLFSLLFAVALRGNDIPNMANIYKAFVEGRKSWLELPGAQSAELLIRDGLERGNAFRCYCNCQAYGWGIDISQGDTALLVQGHEQEALGLLREKGPLNLTQGSGALEPAQAVMWLDLLYTSCGIEDGAPLVEMLSNKSKLIRSKCEALLGAREAKLRPLLEAAQPKMKGEAAQSVRRIIKLWDNERKFGKDFTFTSNEMAVEFCVENYMSENAKLIKWIPDDLFENLRFADLSGKVPADVARFVMVEYLSLASPYRVKSCDKVLQMVHPQDWQTMLENIFRLWMDEGADTKKKGILVPYCIYGSDPQIIRMKRQIELWAEASRGALAAYAVNAVALNGGSVALLMVDGMSAKFPNSQVKNAARAAFAFAAKALELPEDVLSDRIVPTLGFNGAGEKCLDYGPRTFTVNLMPDFSLSVTDDEKGKEVKSLPKPGAKDDPVKAEAAKKEFSELKKQMKAVAQTQTGRLEKVLMNGRGWSAESWKTLFVENPIMHRFATGLVWGVYEGGTLKASFRYMEDGTFNTVDEEEYTLPEQADITLVHPIDLDEESAAAWKQQLEDYEVVQPLAQFAQKPLRLCAQDMEGKTVVRYMNMQATVGALSSAAKRYSMQRGEVMDGGSYVCFHLVDKYLNADAQINFEYMYMGQGYEELVPLKELIFSRLSEDGALDDEPSENRILSPNELPARFVSSVLALFDKVCGMAR